MHFISQLRVNDLLISLKHTYFKAWTVYPSLHTHSYLSISVSDQKLLPFVGINITL